MIYRDKFTSKSMLIKVMDNLRKHKIASILLLFKLV